MFVFTCVSSGYNQAQDSALTHSNRASHPHPHGRTQASTSRPKHNHIILQVVTQLAALGVEASAIEGILGAIAISSLDELEQLLGAECEAVADLKQLFSLAEGYGFSDWLVFDASVVRGLAYYTGGGGDVGAWWMGASGGGLAGVELPVMIANQSSPH